MKPIFIILNLLLIACNNADKQREKEIQKIKLQPVFKLFHKDFFEGSPIINLKQKYPYLFPKNVDDSIWEAKKSDENTLKLYKMSKEIFKDFKEQKKDLTHLFKHITYYEPTFKTPKTFTLISDLEYEYPVIYADSLLFISLDLFFGKDAEVYQNYPKYLRETLDKENLNVKVAQQIIPKVFNIWNKQNTFLDHMIKNGKILYLTEKLLPKAKQEKIIGYSAEQIQWATDNERHIWEYFIVHNLLYSNDRNLLFRFINPAPFSRFYTEYDSKSPGRIGVWIGWLIVKYFMKENDKVSLKDMLLMDSTALFEKSKYKPAK